MIGLMTCLKSYFNNRYIYHFINGDEPFDFNVYDKIYTDIFV